MACLKIKRLGFAIPMYQGIYNAMNKGIQIANGKWIIFMNAGDCFFDKDVLLSASKHCRNDEYGIVYGNCVHEKYGLYYAYYSEDYAFIKYDLPFCHQSCFTLRDVLLQNKFNEDLLVIGDYELYL